MLRENGNDGLFHRFSFLSIDGYFMASIAPFFLLVHKLLAVYSKTFEERKKHYPGEEIHLDRFLKK